MTSMDSPTHNTLLTSQDSFTLSCLSHDESTCPGDCTSTLLLLQMKSRESEVALAEERQRREELERKLQEETSLREELVTQQIKFREKQKQQVSLAQTEDITARTGSRVLNRLILLIL